MTQSRCSGTLCHPRARRQRGCPRAFLCKVLPADPHRRAPLGAAAPRSPGCTCSPAAGTAPSLRWRWCPAQPQPPRPAPCTRTTPDLTLSCMRLSQAVGTRRWHCVGTQGWAGVGSDPGIWSPPQDVVPASPPPWAPRAVGSPHSSARHHARPAGRRAALPLSSEVLS